MASDDEAVRALWAGYRQGDLSAQEQLLAMYYEELRRIARRILHGDGGVVLFQPTELVNEAALRLMGLTRMSWNDRAHFLATAARVMRQVLLDEVRRALALKRQPPVLQTRWPDPHEAERSVDIQALDAALTELAAFSPERARIVELRFYVGLTIEEIAETLGVSDRTVKRQWRTARAWLLEQLSPAPEG